MNPENTHKLMGFYMDGLILGVYYVQVFLLLEAVSYIGCIRLKIMVGVFTGASIHLGYIPLHQGELHHLFQGYLAA